MRTGLKWNTPGALSVAGEKGPIRVFPTIHSVLENTNGPSDGEDKAPHPSPAGPPGHPAGAAAPLLPQPLIERLLAAAWSAAASSPRSTSSARSPPRSCSRRPIKSAQTGLSQGVGVRVISGAKVGYAYSDDLDDEALMRAARTAAMIAQGGGSRAELQGEPARRCPATTGSTPLADVDVARKAELVLRADKAARAYDTRVKQVNGDVRRQDQADAVANTLGHSPRTRRTSAASASRWWPRGRTSERRTGFYGGGGRVSFSPLRHLHAGAGGGARRRGRRWPRSAPSSAGRAADGGARAGLERHPAARGGGPRPGGGLHPQGHVAVRGQAGREGGLAIW